MAKLLVIKVLELMKRDMALPKVERELKLSSLMKESSFIKLLNKFWVTQSLSTNTASIVNVIPILRTKCPSPFQ